MRVLSPIMLSPAEMMRPLLSKIQSRASGQVFGRRIRRLCRVGKSLRRVVHKCTPDVAWGASRINGLGAGDAMSNVRQRSLSRQRLERCSTYVHSQGRGSVVWASVTSGSTCVKCRVRRPCSLLSLLVSRRLDNMDNWKRRLLAQVILPSRRLWSSVLAAGSAATGRPVRMSNVRSTRAP